MGAEHGQYPKVAGALTRAGAAFPELLAKDYARILQRIELFWGNNEAVTYLNSLVLGDGADGTGRPHRPMRQGFPAEVLKEIARLKQVHEFLFPALHADPFDPFGGAESILHASKAAASVNDAVRGDMSGDGNGRVAWPVVRTQRELMEGAERMRAGLNLYPLQGKRIGEILEHYAVVDERTLRIVRHMQERSEHKGEAIGQMLVEIGIIRQDDLTRALCVQTGVMMVDVLATTIPFEILKTIPSAKAREMQVVPVGVCHDQLFLAVDDPFGFRDGPFFSILTGFKIAPVFAPRHEIVNRLKIYGFGMSTDETREEFRSLYRQAGEPDPGTNAHEETGYSDAAENNATIIDLVNKMILNAIEVGASDIHIELFQGKQESSIRFRRGGSMESFSDFPSACHNAVVSRIKIMAGLDISEKRRPQDGNISCNAPDGSRVDLRVSIIPTMRGAEFVTIRILALGEPLPFSDLGMAERDMQAFRDTIQRPYGLVLVCGPASSGKTTTLHSVLKELNTGERKIWTAEDAIEIMQDNLCQVQVNAKVGMNFATVVHSFLCADPDIIMIDEMRDQETAKIALEASMNGHLVLSSLHASSPAEAVVRLLDLGADPYSLSDALLVIVAQRLVRRLCFACARNEEAGAEELQELAEEYYQSTRRGPPDVAERNAIIQGWRDAFGMDGRLYLKHPVGCSICNGGYKGRVGLHEVLPITPALRHLIRHRCAATECLAAGVAEGMRTLKQDGIEKVIRGVTDIMQVRGVCV